LSQAETVGRFSFRHQTRHRHARGDPGRVVEGRSARLRHEITAIIVLLDQVPGQETLQKGASPIRILTELLAVEDLADFLGGEGLSG
jgi:hypothetical protein